MRWRAPTVSQARRSMYWRRNHTPEEGLWPLRFENVLTEHRRWLNASFSADTGQGRVAFCDTHRLQVVEQTGNIAPMFHVAIVDKR